MVKKKSCMDISSDKQAKSQRRKHGNDKERETFRKKLNIF